MRSVKKASPLRTGILFGAILGAILIALDLFPFILISYATFQIVALIGVVILSFWAGSRIASQTGRARDGLVAGLITGLLGAVAYEIDVRIFAILISSHEGLEPVVRLLTSGYFYAYVLQYALIGGVVGLVIGVMGGAVGKARA